MSGQTMSERYGTSGLRPDVSDDCAHDNAQLMFVHPALDEWYCFDCQKKVRVWSPSP